MAFILAGSAGAVSGAPSRAASSQARAAHRVRMQDPGAIVSGPEAARIDSFMIAAADLGVEGTLLVERDGRVILSKGYGLVDRNKRMPARTRTPYILGSLSKQFTAAAIYKLESQGKLHLTDSLGQWFREAPADKRAITLDQLVHHTSGLPYLNRGDMYDSISVDSMIHETLAYPLEFKPGARYSYSSPGYDLLGLILQRASGQRFDDYLRTQFFDPAGMTETGFVDEPSRWPTEKRTPSYSSTDADPDPSLYPATSTPKLTGSGSVISTCGDLWKWEKALRANLVLDAEATRKLFQPGPAVGSNASYAGGWVVARSQRNTTVLMHAGDLGGFNTDMRRLVDEHATIIFLSNSREGGRGYREIIPITVTRILFGPEPVLPSAPARIAPSELGAWSGTVSLDPGVPVEARVRDGQVFLTAHTQEGMFALTGADSAARVEAASLNRLASSVADSLLAGSAPSLDSIFSPSLVESAHPEFFRVWKSEVDSLGGAPRVEVLGTYLSTPIAARTLVLLTGPRGTRVMSLDWVSRHLILSVPIEAHGLEMRFRAENAGTLSRYDLWSGRIVRVSRSG